MIEDIPILLVSEVEQTHIEGTCALAVAEFGNASSLPKLDVRPGFREERDFEVRFWRPAELLAAFNCSIGPSELSVDGFFPLNVQPNGIRLLPARYRALVRTSEVLRRLSKKVPASTKLADNLYVNAPARSSVGSGSRPGGPATGSDLRAASS